MFMAEICFLGGQLICTFGPQHVDTASTVLMVSLKMNESGGSRYAADSYRCDWINGAALTWVECIKSR